MSKTSPYSLRLSSQERAIIRSQAEALNITDAAYIRRCLFGVTPTQAKQVQSKELAQVIGMLGHWDAAKNLQEINTALQAGTLMVTPAIVNHLSMAAKDLREMRELLIKAIGLKGKSS